MIQQIFKFSVLPLKARVAIAMFAICGASALVWAAPSQSISSPVRFLFLLALAVGTAHKKFHLYRNSSISFLTSVTLLSVLIASTAETLLIAVCGVAVQTYFPSRRLVPHRMIFNLGMISVTVAASCWIYAFCMSLSQGGTPNQLIAVIAASSVYFLGNTVFVSLMIALTKNQSVWRLWLDHFAPSAPSFMIAGLLSLLVSQTMMRLPETVVLVLILPVVIGSYYYSVRLVRSPG